MSEALRWEPTPYRRSQFDEIADVVGVGRYRAKRVRNSAGFYNFDTLLNGDAICRNLTFDEAKKYADWHLANLAIPAAA